MDTITILFILVAFGLSLGIAIFQYSNNRKSLHENLIFILFRFCSVFFILLLIIGPKIKSTKYFLEKPNLVLAVDNSSSIKKTGTAQEISDFINWIKRDPSLNDHFNIEVFGFGKELQKISTFDFSEPQTDIHAALNSLNNLYDNSQSAIILLSDGNQTFGKDILPSDDKLKESIYPIVLGDTTLVKDLSIDLVNVNKYAFLHNRFPVEVILSYSGKEPISSVLEIRSGNSLEFSKEILMDRKINSEVVNVTLKASKKGNINYVVEVSKIHEEGNLMNNRKNFTVEVFDQRTSVLLITDVLHPDLGALKKTIESNKQRELDIVHIKDLPKDLKKYELVIIYQPNNKFKKLMEDISKKEINYWIITGPYTDWDFLNSVQKDFFKKTNGQEEEFYPFLNPEFRLFQINDIGFSEFPPLNGHFGDIRNEGLETLLFQQVRGMPTTHPLLGFLEKGNRKIAVLFGSDFWKWRSYSFKDSGSFEGFNDFLGKILQFTSSNEKKERLVLEYEPFYFGNENVSIKVQYYDANYVFDSKEKLEMELVNKENGKKTTVPLMLNENGFEVFLQDLYAADYEFKITAIESNISKGGKFRITDFDVEQQYSNSNYLRLKNIGGGEVFFLHEGKTLTERLLRDNNYSPIQKSHKKDVPLIDWYFLLGIIAFFLSAEWFYRKYRGLN